MKKLFKKNQIIITALALMIAAAGYLSYTHSSIGGEELTQTSAGLTEEDYDIVYDETVVDADIFTEAELDTKQDDTAEDGAGDVKEEDIKEDNSKDKSAKKEASDADKNAGSRKERGSDRWGSGCFRG